MTDLAHVVGSDLMVGPTGDLLLVDGSDATKQRVSHRLLTSPGAYIWQLAYGAGLPAMVGSTISKQQIAAVIKSQMALEATVATSPEPIIDVSSAMLGTVTASITYYGTADQEKNSMNVTMGV